MANEEKLKQITRIPCSSCGSEMKFSPKERKLECENCGTTTEIESGTDQIIEKPFNSYRERENIDSGMGVARKEFHCNTCGAVTLVDVSTVSFHCGFCSSSNVNEEAYQERNIKPEGVIPFKITKNIAFETFKDWIGAGWFHPNALKKVTRLENIAGVYVPFWTFDANTESNWFAEAGYHYYVTREVTDANGNTTTIQEQHTRWVPVSGYYQHWFDDVTIIASKGITQSRIQKIYPFDYKELVNYDARFILGMGSELYSLDMEDGFSEAERIMDDFIYNSCAQEIPGDTFRNLHINTHKFDITFKHILLPVWIAAYRFQNKTYQVVVNGQTGKISGEKPLSWIKIMIAIVIVAAIILAAYFFAQNRS